MKTRIGSFLVDPSSEKGISAAKNLQDLRTIGALRYSLYVERDRKAYPSADHESRCFIEPVDHSSLNLFGTAESTCLSAMRLTKATLAAQDPCLSRLLSNSPINPSSYPKVTVISRLIAAEHPGARSLMMAVMREAYRIGLKNDVEFAVAVTRRALVPIFARMGFFPTGHSYTEEIAGEMHVLVQTLRDRKSLQAQRSVLLDVLDTFEQRETESA